MPYRILRSSYRYLPFITPAFLATLGWRLRHWPGLILGLLLGFPIGIFLFAVIFICIRMHAHKSARRAIAALSTDELERIATDPTSLHLGFAMEELQTRGRNARPSLKSLCDLLLSPNSNHRGLAMTLFSVLYREQWSKISTNSSNFDPPEVWKSRIATILPADDPPAPLS